jgi:hypothetical protein
MTSFIGWPLAEAAKCTTTAKKNKDTELWRFVESGRLLVYGRRSDTGTHQWIRPAECSSLVYRDFKSSIAASADAKKKPIADLLLYPVVHAPNAAEFVDGMLLRDVISKFVSGDPEVQYLARKIEFNPKLGSTYKENLSDQAGPVIWPLMFERGVLGGGNSGDEYEEYFSDSVTPELQDASDALERRFEGLLALLRHNELQAVGDPARLHDPAEIPIGLWSHDQYYWEQKKGDLLQLNEDLDGPLAQEFIPRWRAVVLRIPGSKSDRNASRGSWTVVEELSKGEEAAFIAIKQVYPFGLAGVKAFDRNRAIRKFCQESGLSSCSEQTIKRTMRKIRFDPG